MNVIIFFFAKEPEKRVLGLRQGHRRKGAKRRRVQLQDEVIDIPFLDSLQQMLNDPSILKQVRLEQTFDANKSVVIQEFKVIIIMYVICRSSN